MASSVALIDYGAGNLHSVENALRAVGAQVSVTADPDVVGAADRIVLPGVGAFGACAEGLRSVDGLVEAMEQAVRGRAVPFLGICVGMQLLATRGLEQGVTPGLDWISGEVRLIESDDPEIKIPHMGWNDVSPGETAHGVVPQGEAYFLHSYHFVAEDDTHVAAHTHHGVSMTAAVAQDNVLGVQFHPEKSQRYGLEMLEHFLEWRP